MDCAEQELIADFVVESQEGLADIEQQMLAIEACGLDADLELVNSVFRTMHTIKGTAGFLGLERIGALAHGLEEVLDDMRNRALAPSSDLVTSILKAADYMKGLIEAVDSSNTAEIGEYLVELQGFRSGGRVPPPTPPSPAPPCDLIKPQASPASASALINDCLELVEHVDLELRNAVIQPPEAHAVRGMSRTVRALREGAVVLKCGPIQHLAHDVERLLKKLSDGHCCWDSRIAQALSDAIGRCRESLRSIQSADGEVSFIVDDLSATLSEWLDERCPTSTSPASVDVASQYGTPNLADPKSLDGESKAEEIASGKGAGESRNSGGAVSDCNIRVDVALLDKLMTRVGELVLARNQILQYSAGLEDSAFISTAQRLNLITAELQESVMKTRMQPIGNVWAKFPRVVRDLAGQLGKQVAIEMEGKETELDKTIVEAIKDPLTHVIRNSVDHGIESPEVRRAAGKPVEGRLSLRAYHEGGQVNIEITDDGAGLNIDRIRRKAVERGLVAADTAARMSDREAAQLIFAPGFSTAEKVTSVSGRGVGMDVVRTNIERISGTIDLQSSLGQGTTIRIKIPLTLAIIPALIVTNAGDRYAIPQVSLLELVRLEGQQARSGVEYVHGAPVYRLRGKLLPLVNLSERLGNRGAKAEDDVINIVVLRANDRQFGLVVDKINDAAEIVVKPLSRQLKGLSEYAGATIMGDGAVALILDVMGLALAAGLTAENREATTAAAAGEGHGRVKTETLLVVDLGDARRFALPTSMVSRLEKISVDTIEQTAGREVVQYRGRIMPLVRLTNIFGGASKPPDDELNVVVYADGAETCGFVVGGIVDVVEAEFSADAGRAPSDNLLGAAVIQQRVTDIVNLPYLAQAAF
ncbi:MAG: chemotaxis protein CheW [Planctomycetaceae bacterium]|nr:chemotaxis protein CheW [Planctomycetaceae bacterium]